MMARISTPKADRSTGCGYRRRGRRRCSDASLAARSMNVVATKSTRKETTKTEKLIELRIKHTLLDPESLIPNPCPGEGNWTSTPRPVYGLVFSVPQDINTGISKIPTPRSDIHEAIRNRIFTCGS